MPSKLSGGEKLDVLGSLENAGIDWLVFRSEDWKKLKDVDNVDNVDNENGYKAGNMLTVQDSPSACLARCLRSFAGSYCHLPNKQQV